jgi:hypothetical protein
LRLPLLDELHPPGRRRDDLGEAELGIRLDRRRLDADHQIADVRLAGLQHRQARRPIGNALDDDPLDRGLLPPVLLVRLEHELLARIHADEAIRAEPHGLPLESSLADLLDVLLGDDPRRPGGRCGVEHEEVRPGLVQRESHAVRVDDIHRLHPVVQQLGRGAAVSLEAELHVVGREGVAVVKLEPLAQLEVVGEPVGALAPGLGQARRHVVAGQRLDERVVERVEEREGGAEPRRLGGVEKRGRDRGVERDGELAVRRPLGASRPGREREQDEREQSGQADASTHVGPPPRRSALRAEAAAFAIVGLAARTLHGVPEVGLG